MTYSRNYALDHCGSWRDGQQPNTTTKTMVVSWDTHNDAYTIDGVDYDSFVEWVASIWVDKVGDRPEANEYLLDDITAEEFTEEVGIRIWDL